MLKLLLIGFTQTNANVIQIFIEMTFKDIHVDAIIKPTNTQTLNLNDLPQSTQSEVFIIDFEGVGLDLEDKNIVQTLADYTNGKPILFISRQQSMPVALPNYEWLTTPYTRQQMNDSLTSLLSKTPSYYTNPVPSTFSQTVQPNVSNNPPVEQGIDSTISPNDVKKVFDVLMDVFGNIHEQPFFNFVKDLQLSQECIQVTINQHDMYFNPKDKSIISLNLERMADSFIVGLRKESILFTKLDSNTFQQKSAYLLAQGAKQYTLSQLVWLIGLDIIQAKRDAYGEIHPLKFEARYMPNIAHIHSVPKYVVPLIASCLGRVRGLSDFNSMFPQLTNAQINQVMILLTMSQAIRVETLLDSVKQSTATTLPTNMPNSQSNLGVQKANKTGFFRRLLSRLGM